MTNINNLSISKNENLLPAICGIFFSRISDVATLADGADRFHKTVTFNPGYIWNEVYFSPASAEFIEKPKEHEAGDLFEQSLKFIVPGEDDGNMADLDEILNRPVLVKIEFSSGQLKLIGNLENGAKLSQVIQHSSKVAGMQMEFTCLASERACWLSA